MTVLRSIWKRQEAARGASNARGVSNALRPNADHAWLSSILWMRPNQISPIGLIVFACILLFTRGRIIVGLLASLAFGATALMTLTALGGSSPLIYTMFAALLIVMVASRRRIWAELGDVLGSMRSAWLLIILMLYAVVGAFLFPRLFAGQTTVFIQSRTLQGVVEVPLAPVTLNVSQRGYFVLGGVTALAICILLLRGTDRF